MQLHLKDNGLQSQPESQINVLEVLSGLQNLKVRYCHWRSTCDAMHDELFLTLLPLLFQELGLDSNKGLAIDLQQLLAYNSLESLSLSNMDLTSFDGISLAKNLKRFVAVGNHGLSGTLTEEFFTMSPLTKLVLADNNLSGELPTALFLLPNLEELNIARNEFHGSIPSEVGAMVHLRELVLSENYLTATIPSEINKATMLERLDVRHQLGRKTIEGYFPNFSNATRLRFIDASNNALSHELPESLLASSEVSHSSIVIDLDNNDISGTIPLSLRAFPRLDLRLANNRIEQIPDELCSQSEWYVQDSRMVVNRILTVPQSKTLVLLHLSFAGPMAWLGQLEAVMLFSVQKASLQGVVGKNQLMNRVFTVRACL